MNSEHHFELNGTNGPIPAVIWRPTEVDAVCPLVLAGHGGGGHKTDAFVTGLRDRLIPRGIAVAAIDAVGHGDRAVDSPQPEEVIRVISEVASYQRMAADWATTLDALLATDEFEADAVAYAGLSGGTLFGLPFIAEDRRIGAAVIGACGLEGAPLLGEAPSTFAPVLRTAARVFDRPALFLLQADDDYFPPTGGRALYDELASVEKRMLSSPGTHTEVPPAALDSAADWLAERLQT